MKQFTCDSCGQVFNWPIEEEKVIDEHEVAHVLDLCAPCKNKLLGDKVEVSKNFLKNIAKEKKNG